MQRGRWGGVAAINSPRLAQPVRQREAVAAGRVGGLEGTGRRGVGPKLRARRRALIGMLSQTKNCTGLAQIGRLGSTPNTLVENPD